MASDPEIRIRVLSAIAEVPADAWNACANPDTSALPPATDSSSQVGLCTPGTESFSQATAYNPFVSHEFLHALEASGSATARTGWQPQHLVTEGADGVIHGAVPCYLKSHSRGEYVFDQGWADAYERAGGDYYPKLQVSVP